MRVKLLFFSLCFTTICFSQGASIVYDPTVHAEQVKEIAVQEQNLVESATQTATLKESLDFWKKSEETLMKVNNTLNDVIYLKQIVKQEISIVESSYEYLSSIHKMQYIKQDEVSKFIDAMDRILTDVRAIIATSTKLLENDLFKMSDSERITQLKTLSDELSYKHYVLKSTQRTYYRVNREREELNILKTMRGQ